MSDHGSSNCCGGTKLIFACSGSSDVGEIADHAARALQREGKGKMFCGMGIGGRVSGIMKTTEAAECILAIDGCPLNCVKNSLEQAGFTHFSHLCLADIDMLKGQTPCTDEVVSEVVVKAADMLSC